MPAAIGSMLPPPVLPAPSAGTSTLLTAPPKLVLKLGKAATASLKVHFADISSAVRVVQCLAIPWRCNLHDSCCDMTAVLQQMY